MDLEVIHNYCINQNILLDETTFLSWYVIVKPILDHEEFLKRQYFKHHENQSVYEHSLLVSACAYELAFKYNANLENCAIAGMLHDFYTAAWQYSIELEQLDEKYQIEINNLRADYEEKIKKLVEKKEHEKQEEVHAIMNKYNARSI